MDANWADCESLAVAQALEALVKNATSIREQNEQIEKILQGALKKFDRPTPLLLVLANFTTQQQRYAEAEACYREVLKTEPNNGPALNNLAMLLALQSTRLDEALKLINRCHGLFRPHGHHARYPGHHLPGAKQARRSLGRHGTS